MWKCGKFENLKSGVTGCKGTNTKFEKSNLPAVPDRIQLLNLESK